MKRLRGSCGALLLAVAVSSIAVAQDDEKPATAVPVAKPATENAPKAAVAREDSANSKLKKVSPLSVTVEIAGGTFLRGTLMDATELPMKTSFGMADIPLSEVAGIRLASKDDSTTTVVLHNGDSITGATNLPNLLVETEWGKADITGSSISNILFAPGLKWSASEGLNGNRWALSELPAEQVAPAANSAQANPGRPAPPQPAQFINRGF